MAARVHHHEPGSLSDVIKLSDGRIIRRHHDNVRICSSVEASQDNIHNYFCYSTVR